MSNKNDSRLKYDFVAIRYGDHILIFGGREEKTWPLSFHVFWMYNLYTEQWREYKIPKIPSRKTAPTGRIDMCTVVIGKYIYMFGGIIKDYYKGLTFSNAVWKLTKAENRSLQWNEVGIRPAQKTPSPRFKHTAWNHADKLWVFGGFGSFDSEYLEEHGDFEQNEHMVAAFVYCNYACQIYANNQLLCFDPSNEVWTNPKCYGMIPSCRGDHATTIIGDQVWLYGGRLTTSTALYDDLYKLNMSTLTWTHIQTDQNRPQVFPNYNIPPVFRNLDIPQVFRNYTLNAITDSHIAFEGCHASGSNDSWILDLTTLSWKKHSSNENQLYSGQTACLGMNSNIFIAGRRLSNNNTCNHQLYNTVMLAPRSLKHLAIQAVHNDWAELRPWKHLPNKLLNLFQ